MNKYILTIVLINNIFFISNTNANNPSIMSTIETQNIILSKSSDVLTFDTIPQMHFDTNYLTAYDELSKMLAGDKPLSLKRAVFLVESAYHSGAIDYHNYCTQIADEVKKINEFIENRNIRKYKTCVNAALFEYFTKPNWMNGQKAFSYDVVDAGGERDITKLFVTKLMKTHSGQCQSLPIYYKILCKELNGEAYLAFCPNHLYLKHIGEDGKWYNIELTTGSFARDEWYIESMEISTEAIKNGVFLSAISELEEVAFMFMMLAETYRFKYKDYDYFTMLCAERILEFLPDNCYAMYLKMQTLQQWGYDYIHTIGQVYSDFIERVTKERDKLKSRLNQLGFTTIATKKYIKNVDKAYKQIGKPAPPFWEKFKNNN